MEHLTDSLEKTSGRLASHSIRAHVLVDFSKLNSLTKSGMSSMSDQYDIP